MIWPLRRRWPRLDGLAARWTLRAQFARELLHLAAGAVFLIAGMALLGGDIDDGRGALEGALGAMGCAAAALVSAMAARGLWSVGRRLAAARLRPEEPWLWDRAWARGGAADENVGAAARALAACGALLIPSAVLAIILSSEHGLGTRQGLIAFSAPLALAAAGLVRLWRTAYHGRSRLLFEGFPFFLGGSLKARLVFPRRRRPFEALTLTLLCVRGRFPEETIHSEVQHYDPGACEVGREASYPVSFELPASAPPTDSAAGVSWRLELRGTGASAGFAAGYRIPVYRALLPEGLSPGPRAAPPGS